MADNEEFVVVRGKRARKGRKIKVNLSESDYAKDDVDHEFDLLSFISRLNICKQDILLSEFFSQSYDQIVSCLSQMCDKSHFDKSKDVLNADFSCRDGCISSELKVASQHLVEEGKVNILSYGIGNFVSCLIARYQLAFLLALRDKLAAQCSTCEVYDPVFSRHERAVLEHCNFHLSSHNEEGKHMCTTRTIVFMPHCGKALYNNLLWRNAASPGCANLFNLLLIGNSFEHMVERTPSSQLQKTASYVLKLQPHTSEMPLENQFTHKDIFNDLSIHWFPHPRRGEIVSCLEGGCEEPVYDDSDVEMITSKGPKQ